jgi:hypothetical protein
MLLVIMLESIMFGVLGYAIFRVGAKMEYGDERTGILWLLSFVLVLLGLKLGWDLIIDGSHAIDSGTFNAALVGLVVIAGSALGITSFFVMLSGHHDSVSNTTNG